MPYCGFESVEAALSMIDYDAFLREHEVRVKGEGGFIHRLSIVTCGCPQNGQAYWTFYYLLYGGSHTIPLRFKGRIKRLEWSYHSVPGMRLIKQRQYGFGFEREYYE